MNWTEIIISGIIVILPIWMSYHYQMKRQDRDREENNKNFSTINHKVTILDNKVSDQAKDISDLKKDVSYLKKDVSDVKDKISDQAKDISDVKKDISNVFGSLKSLAGYLQGKFSEKYSDVPLLSDVPVSYTRAGGISTTGSGAAKAASPLVLTSNGLESAHRMGAEEIAKKYQHHIIVPDDANKLVIQQECFDFVFSGRFLTLVSQKDKDIIQNEIDESRKKREETLLIFGILFRDIILKSRGLPVPVSSEETESPS